jgi:hypothetical protein
MIRMNRHAANSRGYYDLILEQAEDETNKNNTLRRLKKV